MSFQRGFFLYDQKNRTRGLIVPLKALPFTKKSMSSQIKKKSIVACTKKSMKETQRFCFSTIIIIGLKIDLVGTSMNERGFSNSVYKESHKQ